MSVPVQETHERSPFKNVAFNEVEFVVGAETGGDTIITTMQFKFDGDVVQRVSGIMYLSDDANGDSVVASAPSGTVTVDTDGLVIPLVAKKCFSFTTEADGDLDLEIVASNDTFFLVIVMPDGSLSVSPAITFAV